MEEENKEGKWGEDDPGKDEDKEEGERKEKRG